MSGQSAHVAGCECWRCRGLQRGHELTRTHGAQSTITLAPRAREIAEGLRAIVPARSEADEPSIQLCALVLARVESANAYVAEQGILDEHGAPRPVLKVLSAAENSASRLLAQLGCTPLSRARLGLDLSLAARASEQALDVLEGIGRETLSRRNGGGDE